MLSAITFTGSVGADTLYLRLNDSNGQVEYSEDGTTWIADLDTVAAGDQTLVLDENSTINVNLGDQDDSLIIDASLSFGLADAADNDAQAPKQATLNFDGGAGTDDNLR